MPPQFGRKQDSRDGRWYRTVLMPDGNWWLAENLSWAGAGYDYADNPAYRDIYGRLYSGNEKLTVAIDGCHLPSADEWRALGVVCGGMDVAGWKLMAIGALENTITTDDYGFGGVAGGYRNNVYVGYYRIDQYAQFWASDFGWHAGVSYAAQGDGSALIVQFYTSPVVSESIRLIVDSGNIPDGAQIYGAAFDGFERDASVRIERNLRQVDSVGGGVQLFPTMGPLLDTWQISASLRVSQERGAALESAVGPYIGQTAPTLVLPPRFGQNSFPGLVPASADDTGDTYVNPRVIEAGFTSAGRVAIVTDLFEYVLSYDLTACPTGGTTNGATTPTTTAPAWLAGKFARHSIRDLSNERRGVSSNGYYNVTMNPAKHGRRFDYTIDLDLLTQAQADELVAYFRGVRHEAYTVYLEFGTEGFASKAAHFRELSFRRNGLHWDGTLEITLARS